MLITLSCGSRENCPSRHSWWNARARCRHAQVYVALITVLCVGPWLSIHGQVPTTTHPTADAALPDDPSSSSSRESGNRAAGIARTIGEDELHFIKAPFKKSAIKWDILVVGGTAAFVASDHDETILHNVPFDWRSTSHRISNDALYGISGIAGGIYLTGLLDKNEHAQEVGIRTAEATVDSVIMYGVLKVITARERPMTGTGEGRFFAGNWKNSSFPSGHSMFAWTIASSIAHQYHSIPLDILMYGLASTVSVTRVTAAQHFPSDVFVGTTFGYLIGRYVAHKQEDGFPIRRGSKLQKMSDAVLEHVSIGSN